MKKKFFWKVNVSINAKSYFFNFLNPENITCDVSASAASHVSLPGLLKNAIDINTLKYDIPLFFLTNISMPYHNLHKKNECSDIELLRFFNPFYNDDFDLVGVDFNMRAIIKMFTISLETLENVYE